jgi:hypothetical protein
VALDQGDLPAARAYLAEGLGLARRAGSRTGISSGLLAFAALATREGSPEQAVRLAAAVTALDEAASPDEAHHRTRQHYWTRQHHWARLSRQTPDADSQPPRDARSQPPGEAAGGPAQPPGQVRRCLDAAAGLGEAEVARLWADGLELTADTAVALALEPSR